MSPDSRTCSETRKLLRHSVGNISHMFPSESSRAYGLMIYNTHICIFTIFSCLPHSYLRLDEVFELANSLDNINHVIS